MRPLAIADARSSVGCSRRDAVSAEKYAKKSSRICELLLRGGAALVVLLVVAAEHLLRQLVHPREILLGQAEQRHDHVEREVHRDLGDEVAFRADVAHPVDVALGQKVGLHLQVAHGLGAEPVRADGPDLAVMRIVHVDEGAQTHPGVELLLGEVVGRGGGKQRPRLGQEQVVGALDGHDVGVLGDRPERSVRRVVHPRHGIVRPQMGQRRVQTCVIGIGRRIGKNLRGVVHRRRAHTGSSQSNLTGVKFGVYVMGATLGKAWFRAVPLGSDLVLPATVHRPGRRALALVLAVLLAAGCGRGGDAATSSATSTPADPAVVQTAAGAVRGVVAPDHRLFAGIPYAAPPIGPLRWQPPAPVPAWQGVRDATRYGPAMYPGSGCGPGAWQTGPARTA